MNIKQAKQEVVDTAIAICNMENIDPVGVHASPWCTGNRKDADHGAGGA